MSEEVLSFCSSHAMCTSIIELNEDVFGEIFQWLADDYASTVSWFFTCRLFKRMVPCWLIHKYTFPTLKTTLRLYDGWLTGYATFRGKQVYCVMSQDREILEPRDYPKDVWDKLLFESTIEGEDVETREYEIWYFCRTDEGAAEFFVRSKRQYKLYKEWSLPPIRGPYIIPPSEHCVGEFTEDEFLKK